VSAHSFTPVLRGEVRNCDVGFLYDPRHRGEVRFVGMELEINQKYVGSAKWRPLLAVLGATFETAVESA
jgi:predicted N-formylglutamate amidohydrolase